MKKQKNKKITRPISDHFQRHENNPLEWRFIGNGNFSSRVEWAASTTSRHPVSLPRRLKLFPINFSIFMTPGLWTSCGDTLMSLSSCSMFLFFISTSSPPVLYPLRIYFDQGSHSLFTITWDHYRFSSGVYTLWKDKSVGRKMRYTENSDNEKNGHFFSEAESLINPRAVTLFFFYLFR